MYSKLSYSRLIKVLIPCLLVGLALGCSPEVKEGEVPAGIKTEVRDTTFDRGPVTIPARPGTKIQVNNRIKKPFSESYELKKLTWEWRKEGGTLPHSTGDTAVFTPRSEPFGVEVIARSRWLKKGTTGNTILIDTDTRKVYFATARKKVRGETTLNGYTIGSYPEADGKFCWFKDKLLVTRKAPPYYPTAESETPAGKLNHGAGLTPVTEAGKKLVRKNKRVAVKDDTGRIWVPQKAVTNPHSVRVFSHIYEEPSWFYPVTENNNEGFVLPGLQWRQFDHDTYVRQRQKNTYPHYIPLKQSLLRELSGLRQKLKAGGYSSRLVLISGSRNPAYNQAQSRQDQTLKAIFSRHQYGDAVDLIVDGAMNKKMDDLNDDGEIDGADLKVVTKLAKEWREEHGIKGGIGIYSQHDVKNRIQSPYIHLDQRGLNAEWSKLNK